MWFLLKQTESKVKDKDLTPIFHRAISPPSSECGQLLCLRGMYSPLPLRS